MPDASSTNSHSNRKVPLALLIVIAAAVVVYYFVDPSAPSRLPLPQCPLRMVTGLSCPLCGLQRALHAMLHGQFAEAFGYNYFLLLVIPATIVIVVAEYTDTKILWPIRTLVDNRAAQIAALVLFTLWGIVRNIFNL